MALIGVFALNLSCKTGGIYSLIDGLMRSASCSQHRFLYLAQGPLPSAMAANVTCCLRPKLARLATQAAMIAPSVHRLFRHQSTSVAVLSAAGGIPPAAFSRVDAWLWPHCFAPMPRLRRMAVICHDLIHRHHPELFGARVLGRRARAESLLGGCSMILCPSRATAEDLADAYPGLHTPARVFSEAPNVSSVEPRQCEQEQQWLWEQYGGMPLFLFVGVDWPHKNHALLVDAAICLRRITDRPFKVVFAGHRRSNRIAQLIGQRGAQDVVSDLGPVSAARLAALLGSATAMVFPSLYEGFGIPLVEAMIHGLPIIACNRASVPEVCGEGAILLSPDSPQRWAAEMLHLIEDADWRRQWAGRSAQRGREFSWQRTWQQLDPLLSELAAGAK